VIKHFLSIKLIFFCYIKDTNLYKINMSFKKSWVINENIVNRGFSLTWTDFIWWGSFRLILISFNWVDELLIIGKVPHLQAVPVYHSCPTIFHTKVDNHDLSKIFTFNWKTSNQNVLWNKSILEVKSFPNLYHTL